MDDQKGESTQGLGGTEFNQYLRSEYDHIAQAHFTTIGTISAFFRYYLLIMAIPVSLIAVLLSVLPGRDGLLQAISTFSPFLTIILFIISFAGLGMLLYVTSLRMDVILYARTVNAIRKHFYDEATIDIDTKLRMRVLPQSQFQPRYAEWRYFGPVVFCFAILNSSYFALAFSARPLATVGTLGMAPTWAWQAFAVTVLLFFCLHFLFYKAYADHREHGYLRSNILGVDIDGVLNQHRTHFCKLLEENIRVPLDPDSITTIPLHDCPILGVTQDNEKQVFNDPRYWTEMPRLEGAAKNLRSLRKAFKIPVYIFTHRPWPNTVDMNKDAEKETAKAWRREASNFLRQIAKDKRFSRPRRLIYRTRLRIGMSPMDQITKLWLEQQLEGYKFEYDKLVIEKGSEDVSDPQGHFRNRFYISGKKNIRFFVEDHLEKAIKLAYICDVVFLLDHPYNRNSVEKCLDCPFDCEQTEKYIPNNVKRVKSWDEIYQYIRRLS